MLHLVSSHSNAAGGSAGSLPSDSIAQQAPSHSDDSAAATLIEGKADTKHHRLYRYARKTTRAVTDVCVVAATATEGRLRKKLNKTLVKVENLCIDTGLRALQTVQPALKGVPALKAAAPIVDPTSVQARQRIDAAIADLRSHKKSLKKEQPRFKAALKKVGRLKAAAIKRRMDARSHLEKDCAYLCKSLPALAQGQARKDGGQGPGVLQAAMQKGREAMGFASGPTADDAAKTVDRLWEYGYDEARADGIDRALDHLYRDIDPGSRLKDAIGACRDLQERGRALRLQFRPDLTSWQEAVRAFEDGHVESWRATLEEKKLLDGLPNPGRQSWIADLSDALKLHEPAPAEVKRFIQNHVARSLRELSDSAFDDVCRTVAPGGYMGTLLVHTDRAKSADVLDAWRQAAQDERVRRYETEPLHAFAALTELIESNAVQGMSDSGQHANEVPLPDQPEIYTQARDAMHRLLRGMCLATHGKEGRAEYLSTLVFERAAPEDREALLRNTTWRQPDAIQGKEPPVFQALMDRVLRITHNAELMGPQYRRLLQEMRVVLERNVLAAADTRTYSGWRQPSDYDNLQGALPERARSGLRVAWDTIRFWSGYFVFGSSAEMEAKRFAYHQSHVDKELRGLVKLLSRDSVEPRELRRAYRDFLDVADDLRAEFDARQFRDTACDEYLRLEFSQAVSRLGPKGIKNLYQCLQQPCPDTRSAPPRFPALAGLQAWWRNKFVDEHRATPRDSVQWQRTASRCWTELRIAVEQEPEARSYAFHLERLASKFSRDSRKDYEGMKIALDGIIQSDGNTWSAPGAGAFTAYDAAWSRIRPEWRQNLLNRLARYEARMDDFLKADAVIGSIAEENRFMYRYFLEGLLASGRTFVQRNPMNRYADLGDAHAMTESEPAPGAPAADNPASTSADASATALAAASASAV